MSSYVLSKKPLIKKALIASVIILALAVAANYFADLPVSSRSASEQLISAVTFYTGSIALFVTVTSGLSLLMLRILVAVGFWTK